LVVVEEERLLVHAGLLPQWTPATALMLSREVGEMLAGPEAHAFLGALYGDEPHEWSDALEGYDRLRVIVNACTRMRFCTPDGAMDFAEKRGAAYAPDGYAPWFAHPQRKSAHLMLAPNVLMLDSGCLWGGTLTGVRLDDRRVFQVPARAPVVPKPFG
jgi:bis(5'-nucleosyl)-tetraphosphatase (symmetrical)